ACLKVASAFGIADDTLLVPFKQIQRAIGATSYISPNPLGQIVSGEEDHPVDRPSLVIANQWHLAAVLKSQAFDQTAPVLEEFAGHIRLACLCNRIDRLPSWCRA